jgi:hypothetical protein
VSWSAPTGWRRALTVSPWGADGNTEPMGDGAAARNGWLDTLGLSQDERVTFHGAYTPHFRRPLAEGERIRLVNFGLTGSATAG